MLFYLPDAGTLLVVDLLQTCSDLLIALLLGALLDLYWRIVCFRTDQLAKLDWLLDRDRLTCGWQSLHGF